MSSTLKLRASDASRTPDRQAQAAENADGRVPVEAGPVLEPHDGDGRRDRDGQGRRQGQDVQEEAEGHAGEGDVGQAVADHGVLPQDQEHAQDGAGDGDKDAGQEGPLEEPVAKSACMDVSVLVGDEVVAAADHVPEDVRPAELLVAAVVDEPLVEAGDARDVFVDDADVVGDEDDGQTLPPVESVEQVVERRLGLGVDAGRRLVEEKDLRRRDQGPGDEDALLLSSGKAADRAIARILPCRRPRGPGGPGRAFPPRRGPGPGSPR